VVWNSLILFFWGGGCSWAMGKFISGVISGFGRWSSGVLLVPLWGFSLLQFMVFSIGFFSKKNTQK
jgi:hypothetical protein